MLNQQLQSADPFSHDQILFTFTQNLSQVKNSDATIAYKIKDGLYLATSVEAFKDEEFILLNWIEHVIVFQNETHPFKNQLKKLYGEGENKDMASEQQGIKYIHFDRNLFQKAVIDYNCGKRPQKTNESLMKQVGQQIEKNKVAKSLGEILNFLEESQSSGSASLIITSWKEDLQDTACLYSVCAAFLMVRYRWSLYKTLQYLNSRMKDVNLSQMTYEWLSNLQILLLKKHSLTFNWQNHQSDEDLVLKNTYLNSQKNFYSAPIKSIDPSNQKTLTSARINTKHNLENIKKIKTQNNPINDSINTIWPYPLKSILKEKQTNFRNLKTPKKRIEFNLVLNSVKQFDINGQVNSGSKRNFLQENQCSISSNSFSLSRSKKISLCVSSMIFKYREQKHLKQQQQTIEHKSEYNPKSIQKNKSYQQFQSLSKSQKDLKTFSQMPKTIHKIQINQILDLQFNNQSELNILNPINTSKTIEERKFYTQSSESIQKQKRFQNQIYDNDHNKDRSLGAKQNNFQQICGHLILDSKQFQVSRVSPLQKTSRIKSQNCSESLPKRKSSNNSKHQKSFEKRIGLSRVYIKKIKKQSECCRKQSMVENIDPKQRNKQNRLIIEYEDFKQMIKKKHSINNLLHNQTKQQNALQDIKQSKPLQVVIQKLKKDVSECLGNSLPIKKMGRKSEYSKIQAAKGYCQKWR